MNTQDLIQPQKAYVKYEEKKHHIQSVLRICTACFEQLPLKHLRNQFLHCSKHWKKPTRTNKIETKQGYVVVIMCTRYDKSIFEIGWKIYFINEM